MWNTSFLVRSHGLSLQHAGLLAGHLRYLGRDRRAVQRLAE
jgi:hypothetical protein